MGEMKLEVDAFKLGNWYKSTIMKIKEQNLARVAFRVYRPATQNRQE